VRLPLQKAKQLLALGLEEPPLTPGSVFGDYELGEELGRGGGGVVYRARHAGIHRSVALKLMRDGQFASHSEIQRFRQGAAAAADLDHPHIVPIFHVGERDGQPFFTMRLLEGGNLQSALARFRQSKELTARLLAKVARAVHFAHEHGVLHRDLKPANILLDEQDEPYVADFGLAKRLDERAVASGSSKIVGTLDAMAPEQARATCALTPAADVYSLGVILYELLTGELPLPAGSVLEKLRWLASQSPPRPPSELDPFVDQNLERICLRCLQKSAKDRYSSAGELAAALERSSRPGGGDEPRPPLSQRLESWVRRHPRRSVALSCLIVALAVALLFSWWIWRRDQRVMRETLETNAFIAGSQAGAALAQLREYAERVAQAARDPEMVRLLARAPIFEPAWPLQSLASGFDSLALLGNDAHAAAKWPSPHPVDFERSYEFRDYFRGARYLAEHHASGAYVARAFRTEPDGHLVFAVSAPVFDAQGVPQGVLMATLNAKSVFGAVKMEDSTGGRRITSALIGPRGPDRQDPPGAPPRPDFTFLVHPGLLDGQEIAVASPFSSKLQAMFGASAPPGQQFTLQYVAPVKVPDYRDAVPGFAGPWLAAFAPVGKTGFAVLVQTRRAAPLSWP
jgi:serine/threonine-protein kinase